MNQNRRALIYTSLSILFWAGAATAFKIALQYLSPGSLLLFSSAISTISLLMILILQGKLSAALKLNLTFYLRAAVMGFLNPFLFYLVLFKAYDLLPGQLAMALNFGWPITLSVMAIPILKQKLSGNQFIAIFVSFIGAILIATKGEFVSLEGVNIWGVLLALTSTFIWASFWLINTKDNHDPVIKLSTGFVFGFIYILITEILMGSISFPAINAWPFIFYIGMFEMGITFVLWLSALKLSSSTARVSNLIYLTPFLSLLILNVGIGEKIFLSTFLGLILIVSSIVYQELYSAKLTRN